MSRIKRLLILSLAILGFLGPLSILVVFNLSKSRSPEVIFFNVSQGSAVFVRTLQGAKILINGGPDSTILESLSKVIPLWDNKIDLIILTNPKHSNLGGLIQVLERYNVKNVLWTEIKRNTGEYKEWEKSVKAEGAKVFAAQAGQKITFSQSTPQNNYIEVLYPFENLQGKTVRNLDNTSIVLRLVFGKNSILLEGDIGPSVEKELMKGGIKLDSDILELSKCKNKTATSEEFLNKVSPKIILISAGKGKEKCHIREMLKKGGRSDITILNTARNGNIKITFSGEKYEVSNF